MRCLVKLLLAGWTFILHINPEFQTDLICGCRDKFPEQPVFKLTIYPSELYILPPFSSVSFAVISSSSRLISSSGPRLFPTYLCQHYRGGNWNTALNLLDLGVQTMWMQKGKWNSLNLAQCNDSQDVSSKTKKNLWIFGAVCFAMTRTAKTQKWCEFIRLHKKK